MKNGLIVLIRPEFRPTDRRHEISIMPETAQGFGVLTRIERCPDDDRKVQQDMITIYFDGLCRPKNPGGTATYGYVIYQDGTEVNRGSGIVGSGAGMTNNVAEYSALKHAVEWVIQNNPGDEIIIRGDSQLVIHQMNGSWQIKSETSKTYVPAIRDLLRGRKTKFIWIPREQNTEADMLSNAAYLQSGT